MKKIMKRRVFLLFLMMFGFMNIIMCQNVCVNKIWDNGKYCAFVSLVKFNGYYYCSFREGEDHIFDINGEANGKVCVIRSQYGKNWRMVALLSKESFDLRDPKLSITPDNRLMIIIGGSVYKDKKLINRFPQVSFSKDGLHYTDPKPVVIDKKVYTGMDWLWRITWDGNVGYTVNYALLGKDKSKISLMKTKDGITYDNVKTFDLLNFPNETTVRILPNKEMLMMVRIQRGDKEGLWGRSFPPYKDWTFEKMGMSLGGPNFVSLGDSLILAGTRIHAIRSHAQTLLLLGDINGSFNGKYLLPSGGDNSYPAILVDGDIVWVAYYSCHETKKASIYLAKFPLSYFK